MEELRKLSPKRPAEELLASDSKRQAIVILPDEPYTPTCSICIIFGDHSARKSVIAGMALSRLQKEGSPAIFCDLDECYGGRMLDHLSPTKSPTQSAQASFAADATRHLQNRLAQEKDCAYCLVTLTWNEVATEVRTALRDRYPTAKWVLVDTNPGVAAQLAAQRDGGEGKRAQGGSPPEGPLMAPVKFPCIRFSRLDL